MSKRSMKNRGARQRNSKSVAGVQSSKKNSNPVVSAAICNHIEESKRLEEVYTQMFGVMRRKVQLERRQAELERQLLTLQQDLGVAEDELKVRSLEARRADRRYRELLIGVVDVADEYRLSVNQGILGTSSSNEQSASVHDAHVLRRVVQAPLERIEDLLLSQGITVQHAESDSEFDPSRFDVAALVADLVRTSGIVVRGHRPAYIERDGKIIRRGAAIVTRHVDIAPADPQSK